jgi:Secretion system C-terminal sorting domain
MKRFLFIIAILLAMLPTFGQTNIVAGEYFIDNDPGTGHGIAISVSVPDTTVSQNISLDVNTLSLPVGFHILNFRFRDAAGHWGLTSSRSFMIYTSNPQGNIMKGEYFFDTDPGTGLGNAINVSLPGTDVTLNFNPSINSLSTGFHFLNIRLMDANGHWGLTSSNNFWIVPAPPALSNIVAGEYFIDTDPGYGAGKSIAVSNPAPDKTFNLQLNADSFSQGFHTLNYRFLDAAGHWSENSGQIFYIQPPVTAAPLIGYGEYFFDNDPGYDSATSFSFTPSANLTTAFSIPSASIPFGFHTLQIRFLDQSGRWSLTDSRMFVKVQPDSAANVIRAEYFFDNDPGTGKGTAVAVPTPSKNVTLSPTVPTGGLAANSFHSLNYRFQSQDGKWGQTSSQSLYITDGKDKYYTPINKLEFHVDNDTASAKLRIDSVGLAMNGTNLSSSFGILPQDTAAIGRHFAMVRGIDYFGTYGPTYDLKEFVVTNDLTTGMLLGITFNPDSTIMTSDSVLIYKDNSGDFTLYKGVTADNTGNFLIGGIPQGTFLFLLKPDIIASPTAINTYYNQQPQWQLASFQNINADTMFSDVSIIALKTKNLSGLTTLSGYVTQGSSKSEGITIAPEKLQGRPMKGASVVLVGKSNKGGTLPSNVIATTIVNDTGYYAFKNVPKGDYQILIDILGVPLISYYTITVDSTTISNAKPNLNYTVSSAGIHLTSVSMQQANNLLVYPNPTSGEVNILFGDQPGKTSIMVVDMAGRVVFNNSLEVQSNTVYSFDLHFLGRGMYNMIIRNGNSQEVKKLILQ